jgi:hypothetical protein
MVEQEPWDHAHLDALAAVIAREHPRGSAGLALWHLRQGRQAQALAMADGLLEIADFRENRSFALLPCRALALVQLGRHDQARAALAAARASPLAVDPEYRGIAAQLASEAAAAVAAK